MASQFSKFASAMGGEKAGLPDIGAMAGESGGGLSGMPCEYELPMEFFTLFVVTFLIYFIVFGFIPYEDILNTIMNFIMPIPKKIYSWATGLIPDSIKNRAAKSSPSFVSNFFNKTLPNMIEAEKRKPPTHEVSRTNQHAAPDAPTQVQSPAANPPARQQSNPQILSDSDDEMSANDEPPAAAARIQRKRRKPATPNQPAQPLRRSTRQTRPPNRLTYTESFTQSDEPVSRPTSRQDNNDDQPRREPKQKKK